MRRSASPATKNRSSSRRADTPQADTMLLQLVMLLACLIPAMIALSSAIAEDQIVAAASTPAEVDRSWIEPVATPSANPPTASAPNRPATLRLPHEGVRPITPGRRLPDPPSASEFDSALVASFTSTIQPLLLNRCAAGKCHGVTSTGTETAIPQFQRQSIRGAVNRGMTLTNLEALTATVLPDFDTRRLLGPAGSPHGGATLPPLSPPQLQRLAIWIDAALAQRATWGRVEQASFEAPVAAARQPARLPVAPATIENNRFQKMLDNDANPQPLPPPQEPQGIIPLDDLPEAKPQAD